METRRPVKPESEDHFLFPTPMIEKENKPKQKIFVEVIKGNNCNLRDLSIGYATDFWAGAWKELLKDETGNQYGTFDQNENIYPETQRILDQNNIPPFKGWPLRLWELAGENNLFFNNKPLKQFWTFESAQEELEKYLKSPQQDGYGGEIMLLKNDFNNIVGFTAYSVNTNPEEGRRLAQKRFSYQKLIMPDFPDVIETTLESLLAKLYPNKTVGLYLDFAISESERGQGLGSKLFDARINKLFELGAEVIIGRTIKTSPAQYYGNYLARGMEPIAYDPTNPNKAIFALVKEGVKQRKIK